MQFGKLKFLPAEQNLELLAQLVRDAVSKFEIQSVRVCGIDDSLADTTAFCEHYGIGLEVSANCVIVEAKRAEKKWYAACLILATTKVDVNGAVRRHLDARKLSFAPMDTATSLTNMAYGGITPIGLPEDWPVLIDERVNIAEFVVIGSGLRNSKILIPGSLLASLPNAVVMNIAKE